MVKGKKKKRGEMQGISHAAFINSTFFSMIHMRVKEAIGRLQKGKDPVKGGKISERYRIMQVLVIFIICDDHSTILYLEYNRCKITR